MNKKHLSLVLYILFTVLFAVVIGRMHYALELAVAIPAFLSPVLGLAAICLIAVVLIFIAMWLSSIGYTASGSGVKARLLNKGNLARTGIMAAAAIFVLVLPKGISAVSTKNNEITAKNALRDADETVCYEKSGIKISIDSYENLKKRNCALIDYDRMQVTFVYSYSGSPSSGQVEQVKLKKADPADITDEVMYQHVLNKKGGSMLRIYGGGNSTIGDTVIEGHSSGVSVEMADGGFWYGSLMKKDRKGRPYGSLLQLDNNDYEVLCELLERSDEIKEYGSGEPFACYGVGISSNCAGIDYDTMTVSFIHQTQYGMEEDSTVLQKCELTKEYIDSYGEVFAEVPFSKGTLYAVGEKDSWQGDRCNKLIFAAEDGSYYTTADNWWDLLDLYNSRYGIDAGRIAGFE